MRQYFKGDIVLSLPDGSCNAEEMWNILMDKFKMSITIEDEMRRRSESLLGLDQTPLV